MPKKENPQEHKAEPNRTEQPKDRTGIDYMKYAGMAFQMGFIILICALIGRWLDGKFATTQPYYTLGFLLFGIFAALYTTLKDLFVQS